jgi:choloylglycine hydrolase
VEARSALADVVVAGVELAALGGVPPLHLSVHDSGGDSFVAEFLEGRTVVFDNPLGVVTNAPRFDWHVTNLRNYVNLSAVEVPPVEAGELNLSPLGHGSGLLGLPGDFTPPSRFVRAAAFSHLAERPATGDDAVNLAFHLLSGFEIPRGVVRTRGDGAGSLGFTQWSVAADLTRCCYRYRTYEDPSIRGAEMRGLRTCARPARVPLDGLRRHYVDDTERLRAAGRPVAAQSRRTAV